MNSDPNTPDRNSISRVMSPCVARSIDPKGSFDRSLHHAALEGNLHISSAPSFHLSVSQIPCSAVDVVGPLFSHREDTESKIVWGDGKYYKPGSLTICSSLGKHRPSWVLPMRWPSSWICKSSSRQSTTITWAKQRDTRERLKNSSRGFDTGSKKRLRSSESLWWSFWGGQPLTIKSHF